MRRNAWRAAALIIALPLGWFAGGWLKESPRAEATAEGSAPASPTAQVAPTNAREMPPTDQTTAVPGPGAVAAPAAPDVIAAEYHPRPDGEWQGMRVNLSLRATCEQSAGCGLAMACVDGRCGPCQADGDCASGEVCVLDHCVRNELAGCRRRSDCSGGDLCVLSGYSSDARNNGELRATCLASTGGEEERPN